MNPKQRFQFIGHALQGDGPFAPTVTHDVYGKAADVGTSYLVKYPRESDEKFARRNEIAFYSSPLAKVTSRFISHISSKPVQRDINNDLLKNIYLDADGKGNDIDVFWQGFMVDAKARGSMLLLIDMPKVLPDNMQSQLSERASPYWTPILPELLTDWSIGDDGRFNVAAFSGAYKDDSGEEQPCTWRFDRETWACVGEDDKIIDEGDHGLGECPLLIYTESGDFPSFGAFSPIADLSKRLYNLDSELDEILRSQTFSLLTMQVPENSADEQRLEAAKTVGETISTNNLMMHSGSTPAFIAPADGPATVYQERIKDIRGLINDIGLEVASPEQRESGIAMQMRFQAVNAELGRFSARMEGLERRAWELSAKWLQMDEIPETAWPRDFNIANPEQELSLLRDMQETAMSPEVIIEQQKRIVSVQFAGMEMDTQESLINSLNNDKSAV